MKYRNHVGSSIHDIIQNQFNFGSEAQLRKGICLCCEVIEFSECIYSNLKCVAFGLFPHWNKHFQRTVRIVAKQAIPSDPKCIYIRFMSDLYTLDVRTHSDIRVAPCVTLKSLVDNQPAPRMRQTLKTHKAPYGFL